MSLKLTAGLFSDELIYLCLIFWWIWSSKSYGNAFPQWQACIFLSFLLSFISTLLFLHPLLVEFTIRCVDLYEVLQSQLHIINRIVRKMLLLLKWWCKVVVIVKFVLYSLRGDLYFNNIINHTWNRSWLLHLYLEIENPGLVSEDRPANKRVQSRGTRFESPSPFVSLYERIIHLSVWRVQVWNGKKVITRMHLRR